MVDYIHVSNGDGIPVTAIVTTDRGVGSTELIVDSVLNWPTYGIAISGTRDVVTGVITEKSVFRYHLDGSIIIIEKFAAGYSDIGNTKDQVVMLKPTTEWGDAVADRVSEIELGAQWLNGVGAPNDTLGNDGDYYIDTANSDVYTKTTGSWGSPIVNIKGSTGPTGATGATGTPGTNGSTWYSGSGAPAGGTGVNGDFYWRTDTAQVYAKSGGSWSVVTTISSTDANAVHKADTSLAGSGFFLDEDNMSSNSDTKVPSQQSVKAYIDNIISSTWLAALPVGATWNGGENSANPSTYLPGHGGSTWVADSAGRVQVGKNTGGTFETAGATGGAETVTLTGAQSGIAAHSHTFPSGNKGNAWAAPNYANSYQYQAEAISVTTTTSTAGPTNAAEAHNNLQPYIVKYMWKRTA